MANLESICKRRLNAHSHNDEYVEKIFGRDKIV